MSKAMLLAFSDSIDPATDAEFNAWYDNIHLAEVLSVPGFVGATRYSVSAAQPTGMKPPPQRYLAVYEIDGLDVDDALESLQHALPSMQLHKSIDLTTVAIWVYEEITPRVGPARL